MMIGEVLPKLTNTKVPTIRFYEQIGLLVSAPRTNSGRRTYSNRDLRRLSFIRHARSLGFSIEDIRALLGITTAPMNLALTSTGLLRYSAPLSTKRSRA